MVGEIAPLKSLEKKPFVFMNDGAARSAPFPYERERVRQRNA
jgi:hypothetical protein